MNAIILTIFVSLTLVVLAIVGFLRATATREHDQFERLALLPLEDDAERPVAPPDGPATPRDDTQTSREDATSDDDPRHTQGGFPQEGSSQCSK